MTAALRWRFLPAPTRTWVVRVGLLALAGGVVLFSADAIGIRLDPFGLDRRRLEMAQARATRAERDAAARAAEALGERAQVRRLERTLQTIRATETLTSTAVHAARTADDADNPLEPERAARLRAHDGELCRLAPHLAGCDTAPGPA